MDSNDDKIQINGDVVLEDDVPNLTNGKNSSDSEDDDAFFNDLFTGATSTYVATDTVPWLDDSDSDTGASELLIKFYVDKSNSVPLALYDGTEYRIGFLDLTQEEYSCLVVMAETTVELSISEHHIDIHRNKFNIKRINEHQVTTNQNDNFELIYDKLNLVRLQFSKIEPFLVKYEENVYFAGRKLSGEYASLLHQTKKPSGTPIRIGKNRLIVDKLNQILDVNHTHSFNKQSQFCVITSSNKRPSDQQNSNGYHRYMIWTNPCIFLEVDLKLMNSSATDDCSEIYAEIDFSFGNSERILSTEKSPLSRRERRRMEERLKEQNQQKKRELTEKIEKIEKERKKRDRKSKRDVIKETKTVTTTAANVESAALKMVDLPSYDPSEEYRQLFAKISKMNRSSLYQEKLDECINFDLFISYKEDRARPSEKREDTYFKQRTTMLFMEEIEHTEYLRRFDGKAVQLSHHKDREFSFPITEELCDLVAEIKRNGIEGVSLHPTNKKLGKKVKGRMCDIHNKQIIVEIDETAIQRLEKLYRHEQYVISYKVNQLPYQMQHFAWGFVENGGLFVRLIDCTSYRCKSPKVYLQDHDIQYSGTMLEHLDSEQQLAVKNILTRRVPEPYILIGPSGTGKTQTLIALIEQIVRTNTQNVLICAPSNTACDKIAERLLDVIEKDKLFRFYGDSCKYRDTNARIQEVSNIYGDEVFYPPLEFLYSFRVIICTASSAGYLTRARINKKWTPNHFGYVIIDDCATIPLSMSLVPIAGLCTTLRKIFPKIILAGDSQQLSVVARSNLAQEMGYSKSFIEELCETNLYSRNEETGQLNNMYITQLVKNYRSHKEIVRMANELFYDNIMEPMANQDDLNRPISSLDFLQSKESPLIFKPIQGICSNFSNEAEIEEVVQTIKQLSQKADSSETDEGTKPLIEQSDIGVITPYPTQAATISNKLHELNLTEVDVGTAEDFQGKDKLVIIISTVITDGDLGVIASKNWINFVINRARRLIVIIGNPSTRSKLNLGSNH